MDQQDIKHIKPYLTNLSRQLHALRPHIEELTSKSLDERLIAISNERDRLALTNDFAYTLNSLLFAYGKVMCLGKEDMDRLLNEIVRVKEYMARAKSLGLKEDGEKRAERDRQNVERAAGVIRSALSNNNNNSNSIVQEPAISSKNFNTGTGKHIKFDDNEQKSDSEEEKEKEKEKQQLVKEVSKAVSKSRSKGKKQGSSHNKVTKKK